MKKIIERVYLVRYFSNLSNSNVIKLLNKNDIKTLRKLNVDVEIITKVSFEI